MQHACLPPHASEGEREGSGREKGARVCHAGMHMGTGGGQGRQAARREGGSGS